MNKILYWLTQVEGMGPKRIKDLVDQTTDPEQLWDATYDELRKQFGLSEKFARTLINRRDKTKINNFVAMCAQKDIHLIDLFHENYPSRLKEIYDAPVLLYAKGDLKLLELINNEKKERCIGVVGTRKPTPYGAKMTKTIVRNLAESGLVIVSGLAAGVDTIAHETALGSGGATIAVLGCGCDVVYPKKNRALYDAMVSSGGLILSEYKPGTSPLRHHFPMRNRIISGLTSAVAVMEASVKSGSLITAQSAVDQGRTVLALPGNVTNPMSRGTIKLIQQGAMPIATHSDVLREMGLPLQQEQSKPPGKGRSELEKALIQIEPATADQISALLGVEVCDIMMQLTLLELKGKIKREPGGLFVCM